MPQVSGAKERNREHMRKFRVWEAFILYIIAKCDSEENIYINLNHGCHGCEYKNLEHIEPS
jgi:hypothetical protein